MRKRKDWRKKLFSKILIFSLMISSIRMLPGCDFFAGRATAEESSDEKKVYDQYNSFTSELENGVLTIRGTGCVGVSIWDELPWQEDIEKITSIVIEEGITEIYASPFKNHVNVTSVTLPESMRIIWDGAFANCTSLSDIALPSGVTTIKDYAFQNTAISTLSIPASVTEYSHLSTFQCSNFEAYTVAKDNPNYCSMDGVLFDENATTLINYPMAKNDTKYTIPSSVTTIGESAFDGAKYLEEVVISDSVSIIEDWAFSKSNIKSATIPASVTDCGKGIYSECKSLATVNYNASTESVPNSFCKDCSALSTVNIIGNVTTISYHAFSSCTSLKNVNLPDGLVYMDGGFSNCKSLERIVLPDTVTLISTYVFMDCVSLTSINMPSSIKEIGIEAFSGCQQLVGTWTLPESVQKIHAGAFDNCSLEVVIPKGLTQFPDGSYVRTYDLKLTGEFNYDYAYEVLEIVNTTRKDAGLSELVMDEELLQAAMIRAAECAMTFGHTRPSGLDFTTVSNKAVGENCAWGDSTPEGVMEYWMDGTSAHKINILLSDYTSIGVGCFYQNGTYYWVQCFGDSVPQEAIKKENITKQIEIPTDLNTIKLSAVNCTSSVAIGEQAELKVRIPTSNRHVYTILDASNFVWSCAPEGIVSVENGIVTGLKEGGTLVYASVGDFRIEFSASAYEPYVPEETKLPVQTTTPEETKLPVQTTTPEETKLPVQTTTPQVTKLPEKTIQPTTTVPLEQQDEKNIKRVRGIKLKGKGSKLILTWKKNKLASKYLVQIATNKKFKGKDVYYTNKSKKRIVLSRFKGERIKTKKKYYVRICIVQGGKRSGMWSKKQIYLH